MRDGIFCFFFFVVEKKEEPARLDRKKRNFIVFRTIVNLNNDLNYKRYEAK
jgi:hypothetical protein